MTDANAQYIHNWLNEGVLRVGDCSFKLGTGAKIDEIGRALAGAYNARLNQSQLAEDLTQELSCERGKSKELLLEVCTEMGLREAAEAANHQMRATLNVIARTTFSGVELNDDYRRGNQDAHATCSRWAKLALGQVEPPTCPPPGPAATVLAFLNSIEGDGYGGMAMFEIARQHAREMASPLSSRNEGSGAR